MLRFTWLLHCLFDVLKLSGCVAKFLMISQELSEMLLSLSFFFFCVRIALHSPWHVVHVWCQKLRLKLLLCWSVFNFAEYFAYDDWLFLRNFFRLHFGFYIEGRWWCSSSHFFWRTLLHWCCLSLCNLWRLLCSSRLLGLSGKESFLHRQDMSAPQHLGDKLLLVSRG